MPDCMLLLIYSLKTQKTYEWHSNRVMVTFEERVWCPRRTQGKALRILVTLSLLDDGHIGTFTL